VGIFQFLLYLQPTGRAQTVEINGATFGLTLCVFAGVRASLFTFLIYVCFRDRRQAEPLRGEKHKDLRVCVRYVSVCRVSYIVLLCRGNCPYAANGTYAHAAEIDGASFDGIDLQPKLLRKKHKEVPSLAACPMCPIYSVLLCGGIYRSAAHGTRRMYVIENDGADFGFLLLGLTRRQANSRDSK